METLTERSPEKLKTFDILANIDALRFDIEAYGYVLDATREQVGNEQLSYLAEGLDRASRPTFVLKRQGNELVYFDGGAWRPYSQMLEAGLEANTHDALIDPRRQFLADWARNDFVHYGQMRKLNPGQQYVWASPYPHDIEARFGAKFMGECGLRPDRKMGFLYKASCIEDGSVVLETQTLDRCDDEAVMEALAAAKDNSTISLDALIFIYDSVLMHKNPGQKFFAGRLNAERGEDAWQQIWQNQDLIKYLLNGLEELAWKNSQGHEVEEATKRHIYGVWALFKKRLEGAVLNDYQILKSENFGQYNIAAQVQAAFTEYAKTGHVLIGCGGSVKVLEGEKDIFNSSVEDIFSSIFGIRLKSKNCDYISKKCPKCGEKNVKTHETEEEISGSCGCVVKKSKPILKLAA